MGNTVVLANGDVNFCCFSDTVVGNVNDTPFKEIWNNDTMRRIRSGLRDQELPQECRSTSCPIFRGDDNHIILTRMDGAYREQLTGTADPHGEKRLRFAGSCVRQRGGASSDGGSAIDFELDYEGDFVCVDLYLAVRGEDQSVRFLPRLETVPVPYRAGMRLPSDLPFSVHWPKERDPATLQPGKYDLCAAAFESGSHPNIASNCYWFTTTTLLVGEVQPERGQRVTRSVV
jgi:hypothetical protein